MATWRVTFYEERYLTLEVEGDTEVEAMDKADIAAASKTQDWAINYAWTDADKVEAEKEE